MVRYKNRYITIEIEQNQGAKVPLKSQELTRHILNTVNKLHGDFGLASVKHGFSASYCNEITQIAIVRVRHGPHKFVASSLPCITNIGSTKIKINTLYVGATLHQCYKVILAYQKKSLVKLLQHIPPDKKTEYEKEVLEIGGILAKKKRELLD